MIVELSGHLLFRWLFFMHLINGDVLYERLICKLDMAAIEPDIVVGSRFVYVDVWGVFLAGVAGGCNLGRSVVRR